MTTSSTNRDAANLDAEDRSRGHVRDVSPTAPSVRVWEDDWSFFQRALRAKTVGEFKVMVAARDADLRERIAQAIEAACLDFAHHRVFGTHVIRVCRRCENAATIARTGATS